jgi:hypothetical protein
MLVPAFLATLLVLSPLARANPVPETVNELIKRDDWVSSFQAINFPRLHSESDIMQSIQVFSGANCQGTPVLSRTGSGSRDREDFGFEAGSVLALPDLCTMLVYQRSPAFPYQIPQFNTKCFQGPPITGFSVNCNT